MLTEDQGFHKLESNFYLTVKKFKNYNKLKKVDQDKNMKICLTQKYSKKIWIWRTAQLKYYSSLSLNSIELDFFLAIFSSSFLWSKQSHFKVSK
jgi:hypothetical protein